MPSEQLVSIETSVLLAVKGTLRYEIGELARRRGWTSKTRSSPVVSARERIYFRASNWDGNGDIHFTNKIVSTFKDDRCLLLESYLDGVIDDDEFILLYDETSKNPELPYEFIFYHYLQYKNTETTQLTALVPLQCCLCRFQFHLLFFQFSRNLVQVFSDLFPFLSSRNCAFFCFSEGIRKHDFPAYYFVVKRTLHHWLPKKN